MLLRLFTSDLWKNIDGRADQFEYDFSIICQAIKKLKILDNVQCIINQEHMRTEKNVHGMLDYTLLKE